MMGGDWKWLRTMSNCGLSISSAELFDTIVLIRGRNVVVKLDWGSSLGQLYTAQICKIAAYGCVIRAVSCLMYYGHLCNY